MRDDGKRSRFESHRKRKKRKLQKPRVVRDLFFLTRDRESEARCFLLVNKDFLGEKGKKI